MREFWFRDSAGYRVDITPCGLGASSWHVMQRNEDYLEGLLVKIGKEGYFDPDNQVERQGGLRFEMGPKEWRRGRRYTQPVLRAFVSPKLNKERGYWLHFKVSKSGL